MFIHNVEYIYIFVTISEGARMLLSLCPWILYDSDTKQWLFPYISLTDTFCNVHLVCFLWRDNIVWIKYMFQIPRIRHVSLKIDLKVWHNLRIFCNFIISVYKFVYIVQVLHKRVNDAMTVSACIKLFNVHICILQVTDQTYRLSQTNCPSNRDFSTPNKILYDVNVYGLFCIWWIYVTSWCSGKSAVCVEDLKYS